MGLRQSQQFLLSCWSVLFFKAEILFSNLAPIWWKGRGEI